MSDWELLPGETPIDVSGLKAKGIRTRKELNEAEARNIRHVVVKYFAAKPSRRAARFDLGWAKHLHKEMFGKVWVWAGSFRQTDLNLGCTWAQVPTELKVMLDDLNTWEVSDMPLLEQAVRLHHRSVHIHPFLNGNGRWSRMLANIWLKLHGQAVTEWPEETIGTKDIIREQYLSAIKAADKGDLEPMLTLQREYTPQQ